ncbi:hypothetical protein IT402_01455 [Candidatus Nomurabacteria bacterium]|nr:hypothetical protein [Candidatus Nomurabacteria bacterium]
MFNLIKKQKNNLVLIIGFITIFIIFPSKTFAAVLSLDFPNSISKGQKFYLDVLLDTEGKSINSVESNIIFSNEFLTFSGFSAKQSSLPIWVNEPKERNKGTISFSGVIPGGLDRIYDPINPNNKSVPIVRLYFISKKEGLTNIDIGKSLVLQNDGKGTEVAVSVLSKQLEVNQDINRDGATVLAEDTEKPKPFTINILERSVFGKTPKLAVFYAEDENGGIERYEVSIGDLPFEEVSSPVALPYRLFDYPLTARAYDFSGNFREQKVTVSGDSYYGIVTLAIVLTIIVALLKYRSYNKKRKDEKHI